MDICHRCIVQEKQQCLCENNKKTDFFVSLNTSNLDPIEKDVHTSAISDYLTHLQSHGHDSKRINRIRKVMGIKHISNEIEVEDHKIEARNILKDTMKENKDALESPLLLNNEIRYEGGAFKILVQSTKRSPIDPRKVIGSGMSSGSGFLIDKTNKFIITNGHVIRDADRVYVLSALTPKLRMDAVVVKVSFDLDIALLKIVDDKGIWNNEEIQAFPLCTKQGFMFIKKLKDMKNNESCGYVRMQKVYAVGYPLGSSSVQITDGIISGFEGVSDEAVIQMTAPISRGNSGGALLNVDGEVIGVTSAGIPAGENIGFAIPITTVLNLLNVFSNMEYKNNRVIKIAHFGVGLTEGTNINGSKLPELKTKRISEKSRTSYLFDEKRNLLECKGEKKEESDEKIENEVLQEIVVPEGVYITKLDPINIFQNPVGGDKIDIQPFDLITEFDGFTLTNQGVTKEQTYPRSLPLGFLYRNLQFDKTYTVTFWRNGKTFTNEYTYVPLLDENDYGIKQIEKEEYALNRNLIDEHTPFNFFNQVILVRLNIDFIEAVEKNLPQLSIYKQEEKRTEPKLAVLQDQRDGLKAGDIIDTIDGVEIHTKEDLIELIKKKKEKKEQFFLLQSTSGNTSIVQVIEKNQSDIFSMMKKMLGDPVQGLETETDLSSLQSIIKKNLH